MSRPAAVSGRGCVTVDLGERLRLDLSFHLEDPRATFRRVNNLADNWPTYTGAQTMTNDTFIRSLNNAERQALVDLVALVEDFELSKGLAPPPKEIDIGRAEEAEGCIATRLGRKLWAGMRFWIEYE